MKEFIAGKNEAGQRLDKLLAKYLPGASKNFLYKMLRKKNFTLNGKKAAGSEIVQTSDIIRLYLSDETYEKFSTSPDGRYVEYPRTGLDIIYESVDYIVINKPAGMLSQKASKDDVSANEYLIGYLLESGQITEKELAVFHPSVCNRLDRNTSGLLIFGKTLHGLQKMTQSLKVRSTEKYYECLVKGDIAKAGSICAWLKKDAKTNKVQVLDAGGPQSVRIETEYKPIMRYGAYTLLEVHLITGKPHQIRAHLADAGHPLAGDKKYGGPGNVQAHGKMITVPHQLLHAKRLVFEDGTTLEAPLPEYFQTILRQLE